ncbi:MAG: ABC transporter substrate-binding protein, partial [Firmicutes bacterium]|nr:ABC transporter substrate-binding protein [Bacillota bacterium]
MKKRTIGMLGASTAVLVALTGFSQVGASATTHALDASMTMKRAIANEKPLVILASPVGPWTDNFSPWSNEVGDTGQIGLIYQPLEYFDAVTTAKVPLLATGYSWSNGFKTLTANLRHGVKWSNGTAFTSADVVFTFQELKKYPDADGNGDWNVLSSVVAKGPYQVQFNFKTVNVPYASYILGQYIIPKQQFASLGDPTKALIKNPIGTGPYILQSFNTQDVTYYANPQYWGGEPAVRTVEYPAFSGNDSADLALAKSQVDWAGIFIPSIQSVYASKSPYHKYWFPAGDVTMLYTNMAVP